MISTLILAQTIHAQRVMPLGAGTSGTFGAYDMLEYDGKLVIAGMYSSFLGHTRNNIQAWDGVNHFDLQGAFTGVLDRVRALVVFEGGLIAAGNEPNLGHVARWDGNAWEAMGAGLTAQARALCVHNDQLYVAGTDNMVSIWTGSEWEPLGSPFNGVITALESHSGQLYAGGSFDHNATNTIEMRRLARWSGSTWEEVGTGFDASVNDLLSTDEGLVIGGLFTANGTGDQEFPHWTVFNGSMFFAPADDGLGPIEGISAHPDGGYILGGTTSAGWINGIFRNITFTNVRAAIRYDNDVLIGGQNGTSYIPVSVVGRLVDGVDLAHLEVNGIRASLTPTWNMFRERTRAGFEAPKDGGVHSIFSAQPWLVGEVNEVLHRAAPAYGPDSQYGCGPNAIGMDAAFYERYYQVWKLDQATILEHAIHWNDPGYEMPYAIASWPGNGDVGNGEPARLAPFTDLDSDGLYEPSNGDYPLIRGDQAVYQLLHSMPNQGDGNTIIPLDLAVMHYGYGDTTNEDLYNTVFTNYRIINRGTGTYDNVRFGAFTDYDLGYFMDDRVGCDSMLSVTYVYNGDVDDEETPSSPSYGSNIPSQGTLFLNHDLTAHRAVGDGPAVYLGDMMNGTELGAPFTEPGYPTHFQFAGSDWLDDQTGDKRSVGSIGPFTLTPSDTLCVDLAYPFARAASGLPLESLSALLDRTSALRTWYAAQNVGCQEVPDVIAAIPSNLELGALLIYPNPTRGFVTIQRSTSESRASVSIVDARGVMVGTPRTWFAGTSNLQLDVNRVAPGYYVIRVQDQGGRLEHRPLIVE